METVEVLIRIPKDDLKILRQRFSKGAYRASTLEQTIIETILDGTVLPEGHGRLVDADKLGLTDFEIVMCNRDYKEGLKMLCEKIENAPTILDAEVQNADNDN